MKNKILLSTLMLSSLSFAQIGVGVDLPHESAMLHIEDVKNNNKGLIIPSIALKSLSDKSVIANENPKEGLIIFNTSEENSLTKGFYYWGTTRKNENAESIFEWNKLVGNNELKTYVYDNQLILDLIDVDVKNKVTQGFSLKNGETEVGKFNETLTQLSFKTLYFFELVPSDENSSLKNIYLPAESESHQIAKEDIPEDYQFNTIITRDSFIYKDELGVEAVIELKEALASSETITSLSFNFNYPIAEGETSPALVYTDELGTENVILLSSLLESSETLTSLTFDPVNDELIYVDEEKHSNPISLSSLIKSAWHNVENGGNGYFGNDIFTKGWVGIGYDKKTEGLPNEKLRVNGSVSAVNSYYADYVFDAYFNGTSALKYDYNFKSLDAIDSFIKTNRHLPGITPISELSTTENGYAFNMSELSIQLLEKTEELYLHTIEQAKDIKSLQKENEELKSRLNKIESLLKANLSK